MRRNLVQTQHHCANKATQENAATIRGLLRHNTAECEGIAIQHTSIPPMEEKSLKHD